MALSDTAEALCLMDTAKQGQLSEQKSFVLNSILLARVTCLNILNLVFGGCDYSLRNTTFVLTWNLQWQTQVNRLVNDESNSTLQL